MYCRILFNRFIFFVNLFIMLQSADQFLGKCDAKLLSTVAQKPGIELLTPFALRQAQHHLFSFAFDLFPSAFLTLQLLHRFKQLPIF